ncbi:MAG: hypothetical protein HLUCCA04_12615 [Oceanicaulis sp. HLUCCA04]|nr:MAG: hypothetical protein HLUCCA04_12615 [Oceanicaulis sp. HLUCCA04]
MNRAVCEIVRYADRRRDRMPELDPGRALEPRVRDWLETQSVVVEDWLNQLVAANGDERLVGLLCQHAAFLREAARD